MDEVPCAQCGQAIHLGEAKLGMQFTVEELAQMVFEVSSNVVRGRMLCAISLLDFELSIQLRQELIAGGLQWG